MYNIFQIEELFFGFDQHKRLLAIGVLSKSSAYVYMYFSRY